MNSSHINFDFKNIPSDVKKDMYFNFFFNTEDFIYNIWNLKIIDYDGDIKTDIDIKTEVLNKNHLILKDTIKEELTKYPLEKQLQILFYDDTDFTNKFKFYLNYLQLHNSYLSIKTEKLLDIGSDLEELSMFFAKKI